MKWAKEILRKWYVILICAVLCAGGLYIEKEKIHPGVPASGDMTYIRVVQFGEVPMLSGQEIHCKIQKWTERHKRHRGEQIKACASCR